MLINLNEVRGYEVFASDGLLGKVDEFFFTDYCWMIRYLVVDTGWLFGRRVLVAPASIKDIDVVYRRITLSIARDEFEHGPGVETDLPVSRQNEIAFSQHYGWPRFWEEHPGGGVIAPVPRPMQPRRSKQKPADPSTPGTASGDGDPHLRSAREIKGYHIEATDGEIGHVDDLIVDDETWTIRYMAVDTRNWMPGRRVLVAPAWATAIDWYGHLISVSIDRKALNNCALCDPVAPIPRDHEVTLHEHVGREPYWTE